MPRYIKSYHGMQMLPIGRDDEDTLMSSLHSIVTWVGTINRAFMYSLHQAALLPNHPKALRVESLGHPHHHHHCLAYHVPLHF